MVPTEAPTPRPMTVSGKRDKHRQQSIPRGGREPALGAVHRGQQRLRTGSAHRAGTATKGKTNLEYHQVGLLKLLLLLNDVAAQRLLLVGLVGLHAVVEEARVGEGAWEAGQRLPLSGTSTARQPRSDAAAWTPPARSLRPDRGVGPGDRLWTQRNS